MESMLFFETLCTNSSCFSAFWMLDANVRHVLLLLLSFIGLIHYCYYDISGMLLSIQMNHSEPHHLARQGSLLPSLTNRIEVIPF